jgi:hypothetical protein
MLTTTMLLTRPVDDGRQRDEGKVQEREGCWHGVQPWRTTLSRTRVSRRASACDAHGAIPAGDGDRMTPDGRHLTPCGSCASVMPIVRVTLVLGGTAAFLGLAILGWDGRSAFFAHPARVALAVVLAVVAGVSLVADGHLRQGLREDRGNRWVSGAVALLGLLAASRPASTDRQACWTLDGETMRWVGVVLFATGGALRL